MDSIFTHLTAFIVGAAMGATGNYFAQKFTDQRRAQESSSQAERAFERLESLMPTLFAEIRHDISEDDTHLVKEFVVAPAKGAKFNSAKPRFIYYENEHENLNEKVDHLAETGFVLDVSVGRVRILRIADEFMELLLRN